MNGRCAVTVSEWNGGPPRASAKQPVAANSGVERLLFG